MCRRTVRCCLKKEPTADRHIITTQAIAGAGSLALAVADLDTRAEIASSRSAVTIEGGDLIIKAEELRRTRTHATAAVDEKATPTITTARTRPRTPRPAAAAPGKRPSRGTPPLAAM